MYALPPAVLAEIERRVQGEALAKVQARATAVSDHYRRQQNSAGVIRTDADAAAYAVMRLPGTYAACSHALAEAQRLVPEINPKTLWDVGCGPGAATLAAVAEFTSIKQVRLTDRIAPFLNLASALTNMVVPKAKVDAERNDLANVAKDKSPQPSDIAVSSYVLTELDAALAERLVVTLWTGTSQALVLVEPGTPAGFIKIAAARRQLIALGASVVAPCTHAEACPREATASGAAPGWCRFVERLPRSSLHRRIKQGQHGYEDESFSYLVATRFPVIVQGARVIGPVERTKVALTAPVCAGAKETHFKVPTRNKEKTNQFKRLDWGDHIPNP